MIWTTKKPRKAGWYWYRHEHVDECIECVQWKVWSLSKNQKRLAAIGTAGHTFIHTYGGEWAGPIPEPKEPS